MTAEYILRASIKAVSQGGKAYCFSAHVPGQGYINCGELVEQMPEYTRQLLCAITSEVENIGYSQAYAEPGYDAVKGIFFANWNHFPSKTGDLLEKLGYACEWSDEWTTCDNCNSALRTQPNSYDWTPGYEFDNENGEIFCHDCR